MPSLPTQNGNFGYYYKSDEFSQSICRSVGRFICMILTITFWTILLLFWWFIADYLLFNQTDFYFNNFIDYIDRYIQQLLYLLLHFLMLILITSTIRPYRILHLIIYKHNKCLIISLIIFIICFAIILEIPYIILKNESIYSSSTAINNHLWCKYDECKFWTLSHMIDYYIYCALLPFLLFILWYIFEFCIFSRFCRQYSLYNGNYNTLTSISGGSSSNRRRDIMRSNNKKNSGQLQMSLLSPNASRSLSTDIMELNAFLNESENKRTRTYSTTYSILFYMILFIFWLFIQICSSLKLKYVRNNFLMIYIIFLIICVIFKYLLKIISKHLDEIRNKKEDSKCHYISIELFIEWYSSFIYWFWLRFMIAFNTPNIDQFIYSMIIHFVTESYKTTFCSSKFYYSMTAKLSYKYKNNNHDDSTIDEWNIRTSLDSITRFFAAYLSGIIIIIYLILMTDNGFKSKIYQQINNYDDNYDDKQYQKIFEYTAILFLLEMIYYFITFIINLCLNRFNSLYPFINYINSMTTSHKIFISLLYLSVLSLLRFT